MPKRIQLRRTKGWRKPEGCVVVARPSIWGNPFKIGGGLDAAACVRCYHKWLLYAGDEAAINIRTRLPELRGKDLACWCPLETENGKPHPCHADVLLELANKEDR